MQARGRAARMRASPAWRRRRQEPAVNPIKLVTRPIRNLTEAIVMPLRALFVVGLCALINWATSPGQWWVQWVALGMGIAVLVAWARAARTLVVLGIVAWVGWKIYQRYGATARTRFEDWVARTRPKAAEVVELVRGSGGARFAEPTR
jgi:hypothetical protein